MATNCESKFTKVELLLPTCKMEELHLFVEHSHGQILQEMEAHADDNLTDVQVCEFPIGLEGLGYHSVTLSENDSNEVAISCMETVPTSSDDLSVTPGEQSLPQIELPQCYKCIIYNTQYFRLLQSLCRDCRTHIEDGQFWPMDNQMASLASLLDENEGDLPHDAHQENENEELLDRAREVRFDLPHDGTDELELTDRAQEIRAEIQDAFDLLEEPLPEGSLC